jgi:hypothetical protein
MPGDRGAGPHPPPRVPLSRTVSYWAVGGGFGGGSPPPPGACDRPLLARRAKVRPLLAADSSPAIVEGRPGRKRSTRQGQGPGGGCHGQPKAGASARRSWAVGMRGAGAGRLWAVGMRGAGAGRLWAVVVGAGSRGSWTVMREGGRRGYEPWRWRRGHGGDTPGDESPG